MVWYQQLFTSYEKCYSLLNSEDHFDVNKKTELCKWLDTGIFHSVHWGINPPPPSKTPPSSFLPRPPLKLANCASPFFLGNPPPSLYIFLWAPLKLRFFSEPPQNYRFWSLIPSYVLKLIKFLVKTSQFELIEKNREKVMTEKNIFADQLFLSFNISNFNLFFMWKLQTPPPTPLKKVTPSFPAIPL